MAVKLKKQHWVRGHSPVILFPVCICSPNTQLALLSVNLCYLDGDFVCFQRFVLVKSVLITCPVYYVRIDNWVGARERVDTNHNN